VGSYHPTHPPIDYCDPPPPRSLDLLYLFRIFQWQPAFYLKLYLQLISYPSSEQNLKILLIRMLHSKSNIETIPHSLLRICFDLSNLACLPSLGLKDLLLTYHEQQLLVFELPLLVPRVLLRFAWWLSFEEGVF